MYRLTSHVQHYDWGSAADIPAALGIAPDGRPHAELWFGAHPSAPSVATPVVAALDSADGTTAVAAVPLDAAIAAAPATLLGARVLDAFGPRLPYLAKLLAAGRPLSLQAHPSSAQARERHEREVALGLPANERNYPDAFHKPEMLVAVVPMTALAGFRSAEDAASGLDALSVDGLAPVVGALRGPGSEADRVRAAFTATLDLPDAVVDQVFAAVRGVVGTDAAAADAEGAGAAGGAEGSRPVEAVAVARVLADHYPGDRGVVASFLLNAVALAPGDGLYVGAGIVHCYVRGFGFEVMAASDNVLRAGLTSKRMDVPELMSIVDFAPAPAHVVSPEPVERDGGAVERRYVTPAGDFQLATVDVRAADAVPTPALDGPRVVVCLDGAVTVTGEHGRCGLGGGEAVFAGDDDGELRLSGHGRVALVWVPDAA